MKRTALLLREGLTEIPALLLPGVLGINHQVFQVTIWGIHISHKIIIQEGGGGILTNLTSVLIP